jgi:hypothetical protein
MLFGIGQATQLDSKKESGWDERPDLLSEIGVFLSRGIFKNFAFNSIDYPVLCGLKSHHPASGSFDLIVA